MKKTAFFALLLVVSSCAKDNTTPVSDHETIHFQPTIQKIITTNCIACHESNSTVPMGDYNSVYLLALSGQLKGSLTSDSNTNPDAQYLHMPPFNNLDSTTIQTMLNWIDQDCPQ